MKRNGHTSINSALNIEARNHYRFTLRKSLEVHPEVKFLGGKMLL
jgi:hypothetical protein